jgi:hypothetical protein
VKLLAARDLRAGEELTYPYGEPSASVSLLLSFGIDEDSGPAVALPIEGLEPWEDDGEDSGGAYSSAPADQSRATLEALVRHGCTGPLHIPLSAPSPLAADSARADEASLRAALLCVRLRMYSPAETAWALATGHLDRSWLDVGRDRAEAPARESSLGQVRAASRGEALRTRCLQQDAHVVFNARHFCAVELGDERTRSEATAHPRAAATKERGSPDVYKALLAEEAALRACERAAEAVLTTFEQAIEEPSLVEFVSELRSS